MSYDIKYHQRALNYLNEGNRYIILFDFDSFYSVLLLKWFSYSWILAWGTSESDMILANRQQLYCCYCHHCCYCHRSMLEEYAVEFDRSDLEDYLVLGVCPQHISIRN